MSEQTKQGDANRPISAFDEETPLDIPPAADTELLRLCDECRSAHARWVEYFNSLPDNMVDQEPAASELTRLRCLWKEHWIASDSCLPSLRRELSQNRILRAC